MTYEQGFTAGERQAWDDRRDGVLDKYPDDVKNEWQRGYWDAYIPRGLMWAQNRYKKDE